MPLHCRLPAQERTARVVDSEGSQGLLVSRRKETIRRSRSASDFSKDFHGTKVGRSAFRVGIYAGQHESDAEDRQSSN